MAFPLLANGRRPRGGPSLLGRRQALGVVLALGALLAGRQVRHQLLVGPDGAWRRELWLDTVLETPDGDPAEGAASGTEPLGAAGTAGGAATDTAGHGAADTGAPDGPKAAGAGSGSASPGRARAGSRPARAILTVPLDINLCSADSLQLLPGVGPVLAARIEEARRQGTIFRKPVDLLEIKGIGPAAMARLAPLVRFAAPAPPDPAPHNPH